MVEPRREQGAAVVEMAFVAMFLVLLVTGVADVGRAIFTYIGIQDAAQEGAMFASYNHSDRDGIKLRAQSSISYPQLETVNIDVHCAADGKTITVTVSHQVDFVTPVIGRLLGDQVELERSFTGDVLGGSTCDDEH